MTEGTAQTAACRYRMILRGEQAIPRSCPTCGLGGCKLGIADPWRPVGPPPNTGSGVQPAPQPMGCICPPGANLTCEAPLCPRRNPLAGKVMAV